SGNCGWTRCPAVQHRPHASGRLSFNPRALLEALPNQRLGDKPLHLGRDRQLPASAVERVVPNALPGVRRQTPISTSSLGPPPLQSAPAAGSTPEPAAWGQAVPPRTFDMQLSVSAVERVVPNALFDPRHASH